MNVLDWSSCKRARILFVYFSTFTPTAEKGLDLNLLSCNITASALLTPLPVWYIGINLPSFDPGVNLIKLFWSKFTHTFCKLDHFIKATIIFCAVKRYRFLEWFYSLSFESYIFSQQRIIMVTLIKWSSLPKHVSIFTPKKFYEIDPCSVQLLFFFYALTVFQMTIDQVTIFQWDTLPKVILTIYNCPVGQPVKCHSSKRHLFYKKVYQMPFCWMTIVLWDSLTNVILPSVIWFIREYAECLSVKWQLFYKILPNFKLLNFILAKRQLSYETVSQMAINQVTVLL